MKVIISIFPWSGDLQQHGGLQWVFSHKAPLAPVRKYFALRVFFQNVFVLPWCSSNETRGVAKKEELKKVKEAIVGKIDLHKKIFSWYKFLHTTTSLLWNGGYLLGQALRPRRCQPSWELAWKQKFDVWDLNWTDSDLKGKKRNESESIYCLAFSPCF